MNKSNRLRSVDIARSIGILAIIVGHFGIPAIVRVVFTFHIPVFYLITGYFMKEEPVLLFLRKKAKSLLIPYLITCLTVVLLQGIVAAVQGADVTRIIWTWAKAGFYGAGSSYHLPESFIAIGAIWFLLATFWGSLLMQFVLRRGQYIQVICVVALFAFGYLTANKLIWLPFGIQPGCCAVLYMYVGYLSRKHEARIRKIINKAWPVTFLIWFTFIYTFTSFSLVRCDYGRGIIDILASLCACYCIFFISERLDRLQWRVIDILAEIGRYSLIILCIHLVEMDLFDWWAVVDRLQMLGIPRLVGSGIAVGMKMAIIFGGTLMILGIRRLTGNKTEDK